MTYLLLSVLASVSVSIVLKLARSQRLQIEQVINVNYLIATLLSIYLLSPDWQQIDALKQSWLIVLLLGVLLPSVFIIMAAAVRHSGIAKSDAAQRLSLFLPILAAFLIFNETLTTIKLIGIVLAFIALIALVMPAKKESTTTKPLNQILLLIGVWIGYGVIDILFKQVAKTGAQFSLILTVSFILAGVLLFLYLALKFTYWQWRNVIGGIILGALNFANILFYIRAHQAMSDNPSLVFAGMNLGVIVLGTLVGLIAFKETISKLNAIGIALALCAIAVLFYGNRLF